MHLLLEMLMGLAAFGTAERPARHPPARWRTVGVLWLALLAALLLGWTASSVLPGSGTASIVGWVVAASIVLVVTEFDPSDLYGGIRDYTDERDGGGVSEWIVPFEAVAEFARRAED